MLIITRDALLHCCCNRVDDSFISAVRVLVLAHELEA